MEFASYDLGEKQLNDQKSNENGDSPDQVPPAPETTEATVAVTAVTKEIITAEVSSQVEAVAEAVRIETASQVEEIKQTLADQIETKVAEAAAAQVSQTEKKSGNNDNQNHNLIKLAKSQMRASNTVMILLLIALVAYIVVDKFQDHRQSAVFPTNVVAGTPFVSDISPLPFAEPALTEETLVIPDAYQNFIEKQFEILKQKPIGDIQIKKIINETITGSEAVSIALQLKIDAIKRSGLSDSKAMSQAFVSEELATAVLLNLPEDIKSLPQTQELVKKELARMAASVAYVESKLKEK